VKLDQDLLIPKASSELLQSNSFLSFLQRKQFKNFVVLESINIFRGLRKLFVFFRNFLLDDLLQKQRSLLGWRELCGEDNKGQSYSAFFINPKKAQLMTTGIGLIAELSQGMEDSLGSPGHLAGRR